MEPGRSAGAGAAPGAAAAAGPAAGQAGLTLWVRMKGLPARATAADIVSFFNGLRLAQQSPILFKRHADGRTTGAAYVRFASADDAQRAVARDCAIFSARFGQRYVHVYAMAPGDASDLQATALAAAEFEASLQAAAADGGSEAAAVLVRNMPAEAGQAHLAAFFSGFRLHPNGLQLGYHGPTTRTGQAFVEFESAEEATRAVATLDRQPLLPEASKRFVRLEQVTLAEMREVLALRFGGEGIVRVRGIPPAEVRALFATLAIRPGGIHLIIGAEAAAGGNIALPAAAASSAFVEFASPAEALKTLEVRLPAPGSEAAEKGVSVRLATRTELRRAHTVPEAQIIIAQTELRRAHIVPEAQTGLATVAGGPPLPAVPAPFAAMAAALRPPSSQPIALTPEAAAAGLLGSNPRVASPGTLLRAGGMVAPAGVSPPAGVPSAIGMVSPAAAAVAARRAASGGGEPVVSAADAALAAAAGLPPGWRVVPHPSSQAVLCINDTTGEHARLGDASVGSQPGVRPSVGSLLGGVSAASWHALASLHSAGSGGSTGSGGDASIKAASAPAVLRPSPRYARPLPGGAPPMPLQHMLSNISEGSGGSPLNPAASPRSTLGFSALSTASSPRSSAGGSGSLNNTSSRAASGDRDAAAGLPLRLSLPERLLAGGNEGSAGLRTRSADVVGSAMPAFRPVTTGSGGSRGASGELRAASTSSMFQRPLNLLPAGDGGGGGGEVRVVSAAGAAQRPQLPAAAEGREAGRMSPPAKRSKAE